MCSLLYKNGMQVNNVSYGLAICTSYVYCTHELCVLHKRHEVSRFSIGPEPNPSCASEYSVSLTQLLYIFFRNH